MRYLSFLRPTRLTMFVFAGLMAAAVFSLAIPSTAEAQMALGPGFLNSIVDTFQRAARSWEGALRNIAIGMFVTLAIIDIVWNVGWAVRRGGIDTIVEAVAQQIIVLGFFFWLLLNSASFMFAIIDGFGIAGNRASAAGGGAANMSPSDVVSAGLNLAKVIWDGMSWTAPGQSFLLAISGIVIIYVFGKMTARLIEVLVEAVIVAYAGVIFLGFGGVWATREYAINQYRYALSVGAKRFFLQIIIGLGHGITVQMVQTVQASSASQSIVDWQVLGLLIAIPIVFLELAESIPQRVQNIINGVHIGSYSGIGSTAQQVGSTAMAAAAGLAGGGAATAAAYQVAKQQVEQRQNTGGGQSGGRAGQAAMTAGFTARNLMNAAARDVGQRLSGQGRHSGNRSFRMAADLKNQQKQGQNP